MTDRRSGKWDRRASYCEGRFERRKDTKLRVELDAKATAIMAELPAHKKALKTSAVKYGIYAALRHGICHS